jgi:uncharacterized protein (TIGR02996 family)
MSEAIFPARLEFAFSSGHNHFVPAHPGGPLVDHTERFLGQALVAAEERPLLLAVLEKPGDADLREVYADWLEEHGSTESTARAVFLRSRRGRYRGARGVALPGQAELRAHIAPAWLSLLGDTRARFRPWQERAAVEAQAYADGGWRPVPGLTVRSDHGLLDVRYSGSWEDEVLAFLASREVAPVLRSLRLLGGTWEGGDGVRPINLGVLLKAGHEFSNLVLFEVTQQGEHGVPWIGGLDGERGMLGRLLAKMPVLETLISPSAPNASFFRVGQRPIVCLNIVAGSAHQGFIGNLARSTCFPELRTLIWNDYRTPFADYLALFQSPAIAKVERMVLRDVNLTPAQVRQLREIRSEGVQIRRIRADW